MTTSLALLGGAKSVTRDWPQWPVWDDHDRRAVNTTLESGKWWMYAYGDDELGAEEPGVRAYSQVEQFEKAFAEAHRVRHAIAVSSGSMALEICMRALDLKAGDEVITTPYTFFATSTCILNANALPVYVDIDPETYNLDPAKIEAAITERTRAILPVHFGGSLCDMDAINAIAEKHDLVVIEDSAQAQGVSLRDGRFAGGIGKAGIFSFQASKCLAAGEGGLITTNDDAFAELAWSLRHYGRIPGGAWHEHYRLGWNARPSEFTAALLRSQLTKLDEQNALRERNVRHFHEGLQGSDGIKPLRLHPESATNNHYLVMLAYDQEAWHGLPRDRFIEALNAEGVPIVPGYAFPSYANPVFDTLDLSSANSPYMIGRTHPVDYQSCAERCPVAEHACQQEALWLVHSLFLGDTDHVESILTAIEKIRSNLDDLLVSS